MSNLRLTFLYPRFFRAARVGESAASITKTRCRRAPMRNRPYGATLTTSTRSKRALLQRHGRGVEPLPRPADPVKLPQPKRKGAPLPPTPDEKAKTEAPKEKDEKEDEDENSGTIPPGGTGGNNPQNPTPQQAAAEARMQQSGPMDAVLHMPPPDSAQHPHISTPPYVHHFDSYTLVKQLEAGGYTRAQAITNMKAVRALLAQNLDVAQEGLVSKSDVDNETYLFRAACSELSSEVMNNRKAADEQTRSQRTQLQHEVDILGQRMSQDIASLKDDVKGMFNDRRMHVRDEQRNMESTIQQINLKISVILNSDSRSEIEGLRWVLIRRSVLGILFMAVLTLGTLRYATYLGHERQREAEEKARHAENLKRNGGREDHAPPVDAAGILAAN